MKPTGRFPLAGPARIWISMAIFLALPLTGWAQETEREFEKELIDGDYMYTVLGPDAISAVDDPVFVSREEAESFMVDGEPVIGLLIDGEARAYSLYHLDHHEIVNDTVAGRKVAVTW